MPHAAETISTRAMQAQLAKPMPNTTV